LAVDANELYRKLRDYLDAEPRIEHGPRGLDDVAGDRTRLDAARHAACNAVAIAATGGDPDPDRAGLIDAANRFLAAEGALRECESEHLPRLERLCRDLAAARSVLEERMQRTVLVTA
jgi:hypothetical protein